MVVAVVIISRPQNLKTSEKALEVAQVTVVVQVVQVVGWAVKQNCEVSRVEIREERRLLIQ